MGFIIKAGILGLLGLAAFTWFSTPHLKQPPKLPETFWRPGTDERVISYDMRSFNDEFEKRYLDSLDDLKYRLKNTRNFPPPLEGVGWTYGISSKFVKKIVDYWLNKYDFHKRLAHLNQFPQFVTNIQGLDIHYQHVWPKNPGNKRVVPLLILHGWPGTTFDFLKVIPMLTTPRAEYDYVFEVVAPNLPGFGFSSGATIPGLGAPQMAVVLKNLMLKIGFKRFYVQGNDWGGIIATDMAALFPEHVIGMHSMLCNTVQTRTYVKTFLYSFMPSLLLPPEDYHLMYPMKDHLYSKLDEAGYFYIQATKPDSISIGLSDTPAGLAAYFIDKFAPATNRTYRKLNDGGIEKGFTLDELIDNVMIYWVSNSAVTAARIYAESTSSKTWSLGMGYVPVVVPSACVFFPNEIQYLPPSLLKDRFLNLVRFTKMPRGGHFAFLEEPVLIANDIWASIKQMENFKSKKAKKVKQ